MGWRLHSFMKIQKYTVLKEKKLLYRFAFVHKYFFFLKRNAVGDDLEAIFLRKV